jgi:hypothetical protein
MRINRAFLPFARYWKLTGAETRRFWGALMQSRYSVPCGWRQAIVFYQAGCPCSGSSGHLIDEVSTPATVIEVLEALIHEQRLAPCEGRAIEEKILQRTSHEGRWIG